MMGKVAKPSLDSLGGWLEGRITKFIAGDGETPTATEHSDASYQNPQYAGAFSSYSTISSTPNSQCPSPSPSFHQNTGSQSSIQGFPPRPPSVNITGININRASSAMDGPRNMRTASPVARVASANPSTKLNANGIDGKATGRKVSLEDSPETFEYSAPKSSVNWWEKDETAAKTPMATTFYQVDQSETNTVLDGSTMSIATTSMTITASRNYTGGDEDEDLGFGNSKPKPEKPSPIDVPQPKGSELKTKEKDPGEPFRLSVNVQGAHSKEEPKTPATSSWLWRIWNRGGSQSGGAVQASLGNEKSAFYYDKDLKKWVNPNVRVFIVYFR